MKKILIFLLAALFVVTGVMLVACNKTVTGIKIENAPSEVTRGAKIDYSKINIVVTYEDDSEETLKLTDKGVEYEPIDTSTTGSKTLEVTYGGQSTQATILVKEGAIGADVTVSEYSDAGTGYRAYLEAKKEQSNKETEFFNRSVSYKVGIDNGFVFLPNVTVVDSNDEEIVLDREQAKTTYKLSRKTNGSFATVAEAEQSTYLSNVENNVYYFTEEAVGETFKLDVTLSDEYELLDDSMNKTVSCEFEVVEGYNVYDALGLSVLDNLNINSWADLKNTQLAWDSKKLSEYTDVKWVIIHNDITVYPDNLPSNYFWTEGEAGRTFPSTPDKSSKSYQSTLDIVPEALKPLLPGSLKEVWLGEEWEGERDGGQRALYVSDGIGISGNYLTLTYSVYNEGQENNKSAKKLLVVNDNGRKNLNDPLTSHYSFVCYTHAGQYDEDVNDQIDTPRTIKNVYFVGHNARTEADDTAAGLMVMTSDMKNVQFTNTIATSWFGSAMLDGTGVGTLTIDKCKFYDNYSQMVYSWGTTAITIKDSEMKRAGGPILIMQTFIDDDNQAHDTKMTVENSELESWLTGSEKWFQVNKLPDATVTQLLGAASLVDVNQGTHYRRAVAGAQGSFQVNLIAVVIPEPGDVFTNQNEIAGSIQWNNTVYAMQNSKFDTISHLAQIANSGVELVAQTKTAASTLGQSLPSEFATLEGGFNLLKTTSETPDFALLSVAPMYQCGDVFGLTTNAQNVSSFTNVKGHNIVSSLQQLYGGCQLVVQTLNGLKSQVPAAAAAQVEALIKSWTDLATRLEPMGTYSDPANFNQAWTAGQLAVWVNPGGLNLSNPNLNLKHFMVFLGEDKAA